LRPAGRPSTPLTRRLRLWRQALREPAGLAQPDLPPHTALAVPVPLIVIFCICTVCSWVYQIKKSNRIDAEEKMFHVEAKKKVGKMWQGAFGRCMFICTFITHPRWYPAVVSVVTSATPPTTCTFAQLL
jgi:hypothetical protein